MGDNTKVPMTKERVGEILYESLKQELVKEGRCTNNMQQALMLDAFRNEFVEMNISDEELVAFVEFIRNDVNEAYEKS
ncbi:MAG: hypothetical protein HZB10_01890 [Candidatus Yonathbacteria bacterium]|nr:hypothetical protein [Candidatus Yonathbacteria bacterium]